MSTTLERPYLSDEEIADVCDGVTLPAAQKRHLQRMGIHFLEKPNGRALVMRSELERVAGAARLAPVGGAQNQPPGPNIVGLEQWARSHKHGPKAKGR